MAKNEKYKGVIEKFEARYVPARSKLSKAHQLFDSSIKFINGTQWDEDVHKQRTSDPNNIRPCLTFNKTKRIAKRIANGAKQAELGFKVVPVDNGADPLIAEVYNTLISKIAQDNNSVSVRQQGFESALMGGFGFWRVYTDWDGEDSLDKRIVVKRIINPKSVTWDQSAVEPDLSDAEWFSIHERKSKDAAKAEFPDIDWDTAKQSDDGGVIWDSEGECLIVEYFYYDYRPGTLVRIGSEVKWLDELDEETRKSWDALDKDFKEANSRKSQKRVVMWCKMAGGQFAEEPQEFEGRFLPIIFCPGREYWEGDTRKWDSIGTMLKDPQRLYNFYRSTQQERLTIADDAPWLITLDGVKGLEDAWKMAHLRRSRYLPYNHKDQNGNELPPPQRTSPIIGDVGLDQEVMRLDQEMLDIAGINLNSLGEQGNETSGRAIIARQKQGELINADFIDGFQNAIRYEGKVIVDLIPRVIPWENAVRILGQEKAEVVKGLKEKGLLGWGNGKYDLEIEVGSVSTTHKQEEQAFWTEMIRANPAMQPIVMDVLVETIGSSKAKLLSQRFKAMLPPQLQGIGEGGANAGPSPEVMQAQQALQQVQAQSQQALQAQGAQIQQLAQENQQIKQDMTIKAQELQLKQRELALKEYETKAQVQIDFEKLNLERMKLGHQVTSDNAQRMHESMMSGSGSEKEPETQPEDSGSPMREDAE